MAKKKILQNPHYHYTWPNDKLPSVKRSFSLAKWQSVGCKWNCSLQHDFMLNNLSL